MKKLTNHQCYCYGIIAIQNIMQAELPITSDSFFLELHQLWDIYSENAIENLYADMIENEIFDL